MPPVDGYLPKEKPMKRILLTIMLVLLPLSGLATAGPPVSSWEELELYKGRKAYRKIEGELRQKMFLAIFDGLQRLDGGNVDGQLHANVVLLCPETADFLYTRFTPPRWHIVKARDRCWKQRSGRSPLIV